MFVLDKSTSVQLENEALEMLKELQAQAKKNGAKVKVGVVILIKKRISLTYGFGNPV